MDNDEFVRKEGNVCPFCGSTNISDDGMPLPDGPTLTQEVGCDDCHKSWMTIHQLVGFVEV